MEKGCITTSGVRVAILPCATTMRSTEPKIAQRMAITRSASDRIERGVRREGNGRLLDRDGIRREAVGGGIVAGKLILAETPVHPIFQRAPGLAPFRPHRFQQGHPAHAGPACCCDHSWR